MKKIAIHFRVRAVLSNKKVRVSRVPRIPHVFDVRPPIRFTSLWVAWCAGFGNQFIFGYEVEVELPIQLENGNEVEYE